MKKIITILITLLIITSSIVPMVYADTYKSILDNADFIPPDHMSSLEARIDELKTNYGINVSIVTSAHESMDEFDAYVNNFTEFDQNQDGTILFYATIGEDSYSYNSCPYGKYFDTLNDAVLDEFDTIEETTETYADSFLAYFNLVEDFLISETGTITTAPDGNEAPNGAVDPIKEKYPYLADYYDNTTQNISGFDPMIDAAELLTEEEENKLYQRIEKIHNELNFDVTFITMNNLPDGIYDLREFFDWYEGLDPTRDGLMYGVNMSLDDPEYREFSTSARKGGELAFNDDAINEMNENVPPYLTSGDYYNAFNLYLDYVEEVVTITQSGESYKAPASALMFLIIIPGVLAVIIGLIVLHVGFVSKMKTAVIQTEAKDFTDADSLNLTTCTDIFTHDTVTTRVIPKSSSSGGGGRSSSSGFGGSRSGSSGRF